MTSRNMKKENAFKIMEWIFFIGFSIVAGWFASGVLEQFFSRKTSFSQQEEVVIKTDSTMYDFANFALINIS